MPVAPRLCVQRKRLDILRQEFLELLIILAGEFLHGGGHRLGWTAAYLLYLGLDFRAVRRLLLQDVRCGALRIG